MEKLDIRKKIIEYVGHVDTHTSQNIYKLIKSIEQDTHKKSILIYHADGCPTHREFEGDKVSGWWWRIDNYDPCGPFESEKKALESLLENHT